MDVGCVDDEKLDVFVIRESPEINVGSKDRLPRAFSFYSLIELGDRIVHFLEHYVVQVLLERIDFPFLCQPIGQVCFCFFSCLDEVGVETGGSA